MPIQRRDALGRFIPLIRQGRRFIQGLRAAGATAVVGVGVKTSVGDVRIGNRTVHNPAVVIQTPRQSKMGRKRSRSKKGRSRSRSRSRAPKRKGFKRTGRRGGVSRKGHSKLVIGRQWPPSEMQAKFTTNRELTAVRSQVTSTAPFIAFNLDAKISSPGWTYFNSDALGTADFFESFKPRNWDFMTSLFKRARMIGMSHRIEIMMNSNVALQDQEYIMCTWFSSDLDTSNPVKRLAGLDIGVAPPFDTSNAFRDILLQSRRVTKHRLLGPGLKNGRTSHVFHFKLGNQLKDRYGNIAVGGRHIRDVTNNPGGVLHTTDKTVLAAISEAWGVDNSLNVMVMNSQELSSTLPVRLRVTSTPTVLFYDRVLEDQATP